MAPTMTPTNATDRILTPKQVAKWLQRHERTIIRMAERGELPGRKIGRVWRFSADKVYAHIRGDVA
jgi:excisionase family DNA binding protein